MRHARRAIAMLVGCAAWCMVATTVAPRRDAARSGPSGLSRRPPERRSGWNTVLGECSHCGSWGSPGSRRNGPGLRAQAPTKAGALTEVGAHTARLTHSRQRLLPPGPHSRSHRSSGLRVALELPRTLCTQRARGRS